MYGTNSTARTNSVVEGTLTPNMGGGGGEMHNVLRLVYTTLSFRHCRGPFQILHLG